MNGEIKRIVEQMLFEDIKDVLTKIPDEIEEVFLEVFEINPDLVDSFDEVRKEGLNTEVVFETGNFERNVINEILSSPDFENVYLEDGSIVFAFSI